MKRQLVLSSHTVKNNNGNKPSDFTIKYTNPITLDPNKEYQIGLDRIVSMSFTWFNVTSELNNQKIRFSSDNGNNWTDLNFSPGGFLGTLLATIGVPLAITGKGAPQMGLSKQRPPRSLPSNDDKGGKGVPILSRPPLFLGNWPTGTIGMGTKKKLKKKGTKKRAKDYFSEKTVHSKTSLS